MCGCADELMMRMSEWRFGSETAHEREPLGRSDFWGIKSFADETLIMILYKNKSKKNEN